MHTTGISERYDYQCTYFHGNAEQGIQACKTKGYVHVKHVKPSACNLLARLFSKKTLRYCHSPGIVGDVVVVVQCCAKTLTFSNISVITEDIYLKLRVVVHYQKGEPTPVGEGIFQFFDRVMPLF